MDGFFYSFILERIWVFPKNYGFSPQIIHLKIGFSIIFTIHFGGNTTIFGNTHMSQGDSILSAGWNPWTRIESM